MSFEGSSLTEAFVTNLTLMVSLSFMYCHCVTVEITRNSKTFITDPTNMSSFPHAQSLCGGLGVKSY